MIVTLSRRLALNRLQDRRVRPPPDRICPNFQQGARSPAPPLTRTWADPGFIGTVLPVGPRPICPFPLRLHIQAQPEKRQQD